jgi:hypothetical protein
MVRIFRKIFIFFLAGYILSACAALGSKTLMKSGDLSHQSLNKIGISQIANEEYMDKIIPKTSLYYKNSVDEFFYYQNFKISHYRLTEYYSLEHIDSSEIIKLCKEFNLDGFICTKIKYKFTDNYINYIPIGISEDVIVEMKVFSKNGNELLHVSHDSKKGNVYMMPPRATKTVRDGTIGALKRITKVIN